MLRVQSKRVVRPSHALIIATSVALCLGLVVAVRSSSATGQRVASPYRATLAVKTNSASVVPLGRPRAVVGFGRLSKPAPWRPAGRRVNGTAAIYTTTLRLPGSPASFAGIAWMDTNLLRATLYSGSLSPGGFMWKDTAPVAPPAARSLVAAFNGGFLLKDSRGGYLSEGHLVAPLRVGAASLVIYKNGSVTIGQWGRDVVMTPNVVAVRQNLTLLVNHAKPVAGLNPSDISTWGFALNAVATTWRSGLGETANGALVYVVGQMNIVDLAKTLVRAGSVRAMTLDMNPLWPIFATYTPSSVRGLASPANGRDLLANLVQPPGRFFERSYARDFVTMSAR